jgi:hypothetical protein
VYPAEEIEELKSYCKELSMVKEGEVTFLYLEGLRLPSGCEPEACNGLLCPVPRDGYPSRLYLSEKVKSPYIRNWNVNDARIGEKNWFAFSWKVDLKNSTLAKILVAHLTGFTKAK